MSAAIAHVKPTHAPKIEIDELHAGFGEREILKGISVAFRERQVTAIIGPSGCGKTTLLRCLNRMHELAPTAYAKGRIALDGADVFDETMDPAKLRRRVGMVFQRPNPFPTMSIRKNVLAGFKLTKKTKNATETVERGLRDAGLWDEVKDKLDSPATSLSGGQQQRLCIARTLAVQPEVVLMDEPCSALDPIATMRIEALMRELCARYTIVIVTHNMQQATRVSDQTAFMLDGQLVEFDDTLKLFTKPNDSRTEDYITGRFG